MGCDKLTGGEHFGREDLVLARSNDRRQIFRGFEDSKICQRRDAHEFAYPLFSDHHSSANHTTTIQPRRKLVAKYLKRTCNR